MARVSARVRCCRGAAARRPASRSVPMLTARHAGLPRRTRRNLDPAVSAAGIWCACRRTRAVACPAGLPAAACGSTSPAGSAPLHPPRHRCPAPPRPTAVSPLLPPLRRFGPPPPARIQTLRFAAPPDGRRPSGAAASLEAEHDSDVRRKAAGCWLSAGKRARRT